MAATSQFQANFDDYTNQLNSYKDRANQLKSIALLDKDAAQQMINETVTPVAAHLLSEGIGHVWGAGQKYIKGKVNNFKQQVNKSLQDKLNEWKQKGQKFFREKLTAATDAAKQLADQTTAKAQEAAEAATKALKAAQQQGTDQAHAVAKRLQAQADDLRAKAQEAQDDFQTKRSALNDAIKGATDADTPDGVNPGKNVTAPGSKDLRPGATGKPVAKAGAAPEPPKAPGVPADQAPPARAGPAPPPRAAPAPARAAPAPETPDVPTPARRPVQGTVQPRPPEPEDPPIKPIDATSIQVHPTFADATDGGEQLKSITTAGQIMRQMKTPSGLGRDRAPAPVPAGTPLSEDTPGGGEAGQPTSFFQSLRNRVGSVIQRHVPDVPVSDDLPDRPLGLRPEVAPNFSQVIGQSGPLAQALGEDPEVPPRAGDPAYAFQPPRPNPGDTSNRLGALIRGVNPAAAPDVPPAARPPVSAPALPAAEDPVPSGGVRMGGLGVGAALGGALTAAQDAPQGARAALKGAGIGAAQSVGIGLADDVAGPLGGILASGGLTAAGLAGKVNPGNVLKAAGKSSGIAAAQAGGSALGDTIADGLAATGAETGGVGFVLGGLVALGTTLGIAFGGHHSKPPAPPPLPNLSVPVFNAGLAAN